MLSGINLYNHVCLGNSTQFTHAYSTSFSWGIKALAPKIQGPINSIYGFVRLADEVVDSFHDHDKNALLSELRKANELAISRGISCNPILQSFQRTVNAYGIPMELINAFMDSMATDLEHRIHDADSSHTYIDGSARCVGSMCLMVFCEGDRALYDRLDPYARSLGSAFQKVNFLRDIKADQQQLGRSYFPDVDLGNLTIEQKSMIEADIEKEFAHARIGIAQLPVGARKGVALAYAYYERLFAKIKATSPATLLERRVRVSNARKMLLFMTNMLGSPARTLTLEAA